MASQITAHNRKKSCPAVTCENHVENSLKPTKTTLSPHSDSLNIHSKEKDITKPSSQVEHVTYYKGIWYNGMFFATKANLVYYLYSIDHGIRLKVNTTAVTWYQSKTKRLRKFIPPFIDDNGAIHIILNRGNRHLEKIKALRDMGLSVVTVKRSVIDQMFAYVLKKYKITGIESLSDGVRTVEYKCNHCGRTVIAKRILVTPVYCCRRCKGLHDGWKIRQTGRDRGNCY
jgi:hypothetical protein